MQELSPDYLAEIGRQLSTLSAFLGGFAIAFLGTVLGFGKPHPQAGRVAGSAAVAAAAFAVAVMAFTSLIIVLHPMAPANIKQTTNTSLARVVAILSFLVGIYALLLSLGMSGWIRSSRLGWLTTIVAALAALLTTLLFVQVG